MKLKKQKRRSKASKGAVGYHNHRGVWRLCWWCPIQSRRRYASTGLRVGDGLMAENLTKSKAQLMTNDLVSGNYDSTLSKHFPSRPEAKKAKPPELRVEGLISQWLEYKLVKVCDRTHTKYQTTIKHLRGAGHLLGMGVTQVGEGHADDFSLYIEGLGIGLNQRKRHLETLKAVWEWGIQRRLVEDNPWIETYKAIKIPPTPMPEPFSPEEIGAIIAGARSDERFAHFGDFIEFLFGSGARIGEAAGLRGCHISGNGWVVWFGEMMVRGQCRPTKNNKSRQIRLTPKLRQLICDRKSQLASPDELIFTSKRGKPIRDGNFLNRVFKPLLQMLEIDYRPPKYTQHSLISNALEMGVSPLNISQLTGHSPRVLHEHYAGQIGSSNTLPEVF